MSYQVLARKWRPRDFTELVGQEHVQRALINALDNDRLHHAYLFTGTRGVGKTTIARILAKSLNCEVGVTSTPCGKCSACEEINAGRFIDLLEVDAASRTKVEDTRELLENVQYAPTRGRYKVYLIDEVHMLSGHSFNALLKTLEEPPPHVKFLLATTDPQKLPVTILSRCLQFNLKRLPLEQIRDHLIAILASEGISAEAAAVGEISRAADGSMRDALSLLDQAIAHGGGSLAADGVRAMLGTIDRTRVVALLRALAAGDAAALLAEAAALAELSPDYGGVLNELNSALTRIALAQAVPGVLGDEVEERTALAELARTMGPEDVQLCYQIGLAGRRDLPLAPEPRGGFEMILLRMLAFRPAGVGTQPVSAAAASSGTTPATAASRTAPPPRPQVAEAVPASVAEPSPQAHAAPAARSAPAAAPVSIDWTTLAAALPLGGLARQLALNCALLRHEGDSVELALDPGQRALHNKKWEEVLAKALSEHLGQPIRLTIQLGAGGGETPMAAQQRRGQERQAEAQASIESDATVQSILDRFDGRIEPGSIQPVE
jgi:DNA polymerase-3 subunit gamma/tau